MTIKRTLAGTAILLAFALAALGWRYHANDAYPDVTTTPLFDDSQLEVAVTSPEPIGNVAVDARGRIFYTIHPESRPSGAKLYVFENGRSLPFPDTNTQKALFVTPLGLVVDSIGMIWVIDPGNHAMKGARLISLDANGHVARVLHLDSDIAPRGSFLQDLQIDRDRQHIYIADASFWRRHPALIVIDLATGKGRRVLEDDPSVFPQRWLIRTPQMPMRFFGLVTLNIGVDGITLSRDGTWLYYGAMVHDSLYRVPVSALLHGSEQQIRAAVQRVGTKPLSDGLTTDPAGNVLITDVEHGAVLRMMSNGSLQTLVRTPKIRWSDALSLGPDHALYIADSAIPDHLLRTKSHIRAAAPYFIYRLRTQPTTPSSLPTGSLVSPPDGNARPRHHRPVRYGDERHRSSRHPTRLR